MRSHQTTHQPPPDTPSKQEESKKQAKTGAVVLCPPLCRPLFRLQLSTMSSSPTPPKKMKTSVVNSKDLPATLCAKGSATTSLSDADLRQEIAGFLSQLGGREDVLLLPPDFTRFHSQAGKLTQMICEHYNFVPSQDTSSPTATTTSSCQPVIQILPALGTHAPMTETELRTMYGEALLAKQPFVVHDWRKDVVTIGEVPASMVETATDGQVSRPWPAQLNELVWSKRHGATATASEDQGERPKPLVISIGQVVPHEVMGMANFNKNLFVGTGGVAAINLSHFIGAVHGMERMMGKAQNPLRDILNHASQHFLEDHLDLWYILTVVAPEPSTGDLAVRGLYIGRDIGCYTAACDLSLQVNFTLMDHPIQRCVVYLDPDEFHSTWLGNKAIYRTRMAMADGGTLIILAPGVERFGEDKAVDSLIRQYGYKGTSTTLAHMEADASLRENLSAVAHLMHGSTEGRFRVIYAPGKLSEAEMLQAGFQYGDLATLQKRYDPSILSTGWHKDEDGEFFFIQNPALGLWASKSRFEGRG
jgi:nickel-dependent lactate racemase